MRKWIPVLVLSFLVGLSFGQVLPNYDDIKLLKPEDFTPHTDSIALIASNYVLSLPLRTETQPRLNSMQYLIKWMTGTPQFTFSLREPIGKITRKDSDLMSIYMACMVKYAVEHRARKPGDYEISVNGMKLLLEYCKLESNHVKVTGELKKTMEAYDRGELEKVMR